MPARGRPKTPADQALTERLDFRCTRAEREQLNAWIAASTAKSQSDFVRSRVFNRPVIARTDQDAYYELKRIGINLNQIARHLNQGFPVRAPELVEEIGALRTLMSKWVETL